MQTLIENLKKLAAQKISKAKLQALQQARADASDLLERLEPRSSRTFSRHAKRLSLFWANLSNPVSMSLKWQRTRMSELDALQAEVDALKRLQTEIAGRQGLNAPLAALLPAILDCASKGEL